MWFSKQLPLASLVELCRALRHSLGAGLSLVDVFRQQSQRGTAPVRPVAERIRAELEKGSSLEAALAREPGVFPPLFVDLAVVGEETGHLPGIFQELEEYYRLQQQLARKFRSQIAAPVVQFFIAVFVIAGMLFVLGAIASGSGKQAADPLGWGLRGARGAGLFLVTVFGLIGLLIGLYLVLTRSLRRKAAVDEVLLKIPVVGPCLQAFALGRFTLALRLTLDSEMPITKALRLSLRATSNQAFVARTDIVVAALKEGEDLGLALAKAQIFPEDFLNIVAVGEEGGRVPEVMKQQAAYYQEEAGRRLKALARAAGFLVWVLYAAFMIIAIFRLASYYFSALGGV
jgi:type II secretory pathway component PulF